MKKTLCVTALASIITGCASIQLNPNASKIIASPNTAPKGCKYLGQVVGNQGNFFTGSYTSNRNLEEGAINDMKNRASNMPSANYIQIINNRAGVTGSMGGSNSYMSGSSHQTNVTYVGNVYHCPLSLIEE